MLYAINGRTAMTEERSIRKVRILELIQTIGIGGAETVMLNTSRLLNRERFEVHALVVGGGALVDKLRENDIGVDTYTFTHRYNRGLIKCIRDLIKKHKIDIVHSHLSRMNSYGFIASRWTPAVNVMTVHGLSEFSEFWGRLYYAAFGRFSGMVVTVSNILAEEFRKSTGVNRRKITVIPNGIDISRFGRSFDRRKTLQRFSIPAENDIILAVGNLREIKGYEFLIDAFAAVAGERDSLALVICGGDYPGYRNNLDSRIKRLGLSERIYFTDFVSDIEALYSAADVYALTSITEGFSLTTVEAMASSKAVISTDCVGPREIIDDGIDGVIVPDRDPDRFGRLMLELIVDKKRREELGRSARAKVEARYSIEKSVAAFEKLFISLTS